RGRAALAAVALAGAGELAPLTPASPLAEKRMFAATSEVGTKTLFAAFAAGAPAIEGVVRRTETITGSDGNSIALYIHRPANGSGTRPAMLHLHGGGMVILSAQNPLFARWRDSLAANGLVVIGVEFRNGAGELGDHPFPAGLSDCTRALDWTHDNRAELGISTLMLCGDSGGGNLALATTLKAKRDGRLGCIDGVYALCPYISGAYADKDPALPSLYENDTYFIACANMAILASIYDPGGDNAKNPLCWPYWAEADDLRGLPPHAISVNELDLLRDEGLAYYRKLLGAGVPAMCRTVNGTCHAGDLMLPGPLADVQEATLRDVVGFAYSL
ncbi:MAG: alpha/beta hydrolase fold domain-containing protein, partial [Myxococcota bacterium]